MRRWSLPAGPVSAAVVYMLLTHTGLTDDARGALAAASWMAVWWLTEAVALAATSLLPLVLFPVFGVASVGEAAKPYAHKVIFLFMGGMLIAKAMERWNLHRRIALTVLARVGDRPGSVVAAFMGVTAFLSMWVSNTATAVMMVAIAVSAAAQMRERAGDCGNALAVSMMLGIAYAASIGGMASLIGTPPNAVLAAFIEDHYGKSVGFLEWMRVGLPVAALMLPAAWFMLTRVLYPIKIKRLPGGRGFFRKELAGLGPMKSAERRALGVFVSVALLWCIRPFITRVFPAFAAVDDTVIAVAGALSLFALPSGTGKALLDWKNAERIPWGVLLLFGGGLSLASAISESGAAQYLGHCFHGLRNWGALPLVAAATALIVLLTELTSNTATTAAFMPIFAALADGTGIAPAMLLYPVALGASCAFMMPVATPPNAVVFSSGEVTIRQMVRAGIFLNLAAIAVITAWAFLNPI